MNGGTEERNPPRRLLSVAGAAETLGISTSGVKRLIRSGGLLTIEVGVAVRLPLAAIDRLVQAKAHDEKPGDVQGVVDVLATLDELRAGQAQLLQEARRLREDIANLLKKQDQRPRDESLLTVKDVAELLIVSQHTVYGWAERREGPPFSRIGRTLRFRRRDVLDWLEANRQEPPYWRVELESRRRAEAGLRRQEVELEEEWTTADAPGLLDNVGVAVILDVPVGTVDGWRFSGRGPRWARMGGVVRYRADDVRGWLLEERELQAKRTDRRFRRIDCDAALERLEAGA
jgi:excisionase family DNA binding protein